MPSSPPLLSCKHNNCAYSTTRKDHLDVHARSHTNERPYPCSLCPYAAKHSSALRRHGLIHSPVKDLKCQTCGKGFSRKDHLASHTSSCQKREQSISGKRKRSSANDDEYVELDSVFQAGETTEEEDASVRSRLRDRSSLTSVFNPSSTTDIDDLRESSESNAKLSTGLGSKKLNTHTPSRSKRKPTPPSTYARRKKLEVVVPCVETIWPWYSSQERAGERRISSPDPSNDVREPGASPSSLPQDIPNTFATIPTLDEMEESEVADMLLLNVA
ncbi:hypothetical protein CYLTODRAFT_391830 [Cylindrobasidium torrendii FP15055 ss-10]|uniref:C2H2-type domain-containing protein n=1 Tax=Cylindrobasidium torrendii FP15055 ss-10 TaxID=1314674 RepID=A0A0D7BJY3_9AGAR|nr:hypothetical protein CYLTODRAFT_391830 [Cylindrobasidium torrendii FP15055 ss-10]